MNYQTKLLLWIVGGTTVIFGGGALLNRAAAKGKKNGQVVDGVKKPLAGATVRWTRKLYTAAVHRAAAPAGTEPAYTWATWKTADLAPFRGDLNKASDAGKMAMHGPADSFLAAVGAANAWIDGASLPPKPTPDPKPAPGPIVEPPKPGPTVDDDDKPPDPGMIGWYTRGPFTITTYAVPDAPPGSNEWRWMVYRSLEVALHGGDWEKILELEPPIDQAGGESNSWFDARQDANAWVDAQLLGEAVSAPAKPEDVIAYPPFAKPAELLPEEDGLVEYPDCVAIFVGPRFWDRAGNIAGWLWDNGQKDPAVIRNAILDEFTSLCRTASTPATKAFRSELSRHLRALSELKQAQ